MLSKGGAAAISCAGLTSIACGAMAVAVSLAYQNLSNSQEGVVISGRVVDPHRLRPEDALVTIGREHDGSYGRTPVSVNADGSFVTPRVKPGTYVLEVQATPFSATQRAKVIGFEIVPVGARDVSGVVLAIRRDTAIAGTFRMDGDNPKAAWPPEIVVSAYLALDGLPLLNGAGADGAPDGKFVLRNAFGPRVIRCGYTLAPGHRWWPSRILLDAQDVTNVPTDFSAHEGGRLEVWFTQRPARLAGTVIDADGKPVRAPWILVWSADPALRQKWSRTSDVTQGDTAGRFSLAALPGTYLVRAVPQATFDSWSDARRRLLDFASGGVSMAVKEREAATAEVRLSRP